MTRPKWLNPPDDLDEKSAVYWRDYASGYYRAGKLTVEGYQQFHTLCVLLALRDRCAEDIGANGAVVRSNSGAAKPNPAANLLLRTEKRVAELMRYFR